jgi:hypothetical protein
VSRIAKYPLCQQLARKICLISFKVSFVYAVG